MLFRVGVAFLVVASFVCVTVDVANAACGIYEELECSDVVINYVAYNCDAICVNDVCPASENMDMINIESGKFFAGVTTNGGNEATALNDPVYCRVKWSCTGCLNGKCWFDWINADPDFSLHEPHVEYNVEDPCYDYGEDYGQ